MKGLIASSIFAVASFSVAQAAVTININNFSSNTVGVPIVTSAGAAVDQGQAFAAVGIFGAGVNFATMTATQVLAFFTPADATSVGINASFDGLFGGQDLNGNYPGGFAGSNAYIVIGNASSILTSTQIAVYNVGSVFPTPDGLGNASATYSASTAANFVYGTVRSVTVQPGISGGNYTSGVVMISAPIPEPSTAILGAVGALALLRRRRN